MIRDLIRFAILLAFGLLEPSMANAQAPSKIYCERNQIEASKQVEIALENRKNEKRAAAAAAAFAGCMGLSAAIGFTDLGSMAMACMTAAGFTYGALTALETRQITRDVYNRYRDARCRAEVVR